MANTVDAAIATMIANCEKNAGKPFEAWVALARKEKLARKDAEIDAKLIGWLRAAYEQAQEKSMRKALALVMSAVLLAILPTCVEAQGTDPDRTLVKRVVVKAPIDAVWKAWTTTEGIKSFFAPDARIEARPGGPFEVYINPYARPGLKGADDMVVLAVQEPTMISFTWNSPPHLAEVRPQRTSVQVRLKSLAANETEVRLVHGGWGEGGPWEQSFKYFDTAWGNVLANLQKRFVEGPVDWTDFLKRMKAYQDSVDAKAAGGKP